MCGLISALRLYDLYGLHGWERLPFGHWSFMGKICSSLHQAVLPHMQLPLWFTHSSRATASSCMPGALSVANEFVHADRVALQI